MKATHGQRINDLLVGRSIVLEKIPAGGSLEARKLSTGPVVFYWRHTRDRRTVRQPIGPYDASAPPKALQRTGKGYSVAAAMETARSLAKADAETPGGIRAGQERERQAAAAAAQAQAARERYTLGALCTTYCEWLEKQGKESHADARNIFKNHLHESALAARPASDVTNKDIAGLVRTLNEAGKTTTGRKLRAYIRAAYSCAVRAELDPGMPAAFADFKVSHNPVEGVTAGKTSADKNPLPAADLRRYWDALKAEPGAIGAALRLHVLTGGQRTAQLTRVQAPVAGAVLQLLDPKGKRSAPRVHLLPLTKATRAEIARLAGQGFLLSTDGGHTRMHPTSMSTWAQAVATRAGIQGFQLKRVRSGIETMLAAAGVSRELRGQLQSHGVGGVQDRHYDAHDYLPEKRKALGLLVDLLEKKPAAKRRADSK